LSSKKRKIALSNKRKERKNAMSNSKENKKVSWGTIISTSCVAFGIHVGGGFATGNQTVNFFVKYGWVAVLMPVVAMVILNLVFHNGLINAQLNSVSNYREWSDAVFYPLNKLFSNIYEVCYIIILTLAISASIAGAASLLQTYGLPYGIGVVFTGLLFFLLTIFGKELLSKASTFMTVCIVISMLCIVYFGLTDVKADFGTMVNTANAPLGLGPAIWAMLQYAGYQAYTVATISPYASVLQSKDNVKKMTIINFIINTSILGLSALMLLAWMPHLKGETLPILFIATNTGHPWLRYLYSVVLFMAFVSTGIGCIFGFVARFENKIFTNLGITVRRAIMSLISMMVSMAVSMLGLTVIVSKGYAYMGIIGIFLVILPCLTLVAYRNIKGIATVKGSGGQTAVQTAKVIVKEK